jgi:hypothetical protein
MSNWTDNLKLLTLENDAIPESKILTILPHEKYNDWDNFMRGKTCPILDNGDHGVYSWDLKQFLNKK